MDTTIEQDLRARIEELENQVKNLQPLDGKTILIKAVIIAGPDCDGDFFAETESGCEIECLSRDDFTIVDE